MRTQSLDTTPAFERVQIARVRAFSPAKKITSVRSWTHSLTYANVYAHSTEATPLSAQERITQFLLREYGQALALCFQQYAERHAAWTLPDPDLQPTLLASGELFTQLGIRYALCGSIAGSVYGLPRSAQDVDFSADIRAEHLPSFLEHVPTAFLFDEQHVLQAIARTAPFSLLHLSSLIKVDIIPPSCSFEEYALRQAQPIQLIEGEAPLQMLRPEDILLLGFVWYRRTGEKADDQWNDLLGLLKVQAPLLNLAYLVEQAKLLGCTDLLEQGLMDAGMKEV
jgi:hypothetical protein